MAFADTSEARAFARQATEKQAQQVRAYEGRKQYVETKLEGKTIAELTPDERKLAETYYYQKGFITNEEMRQAKAQEATKVTEVSAATVTPVKATGSMVTMGISADTKFMGAGEKALIYGGGILQDVGKIFSPISSAMSEGIKQSFTDTSSWIYQVPGEGRFTEQKHVTTEYVAATYEQMPIGQAFTMEVLHKSMGNPLQFTQEQIIADLKPKYETRAREELITARVLDIGLISVASFGVGALIGAPATAISLVYPTAGKIATGIGITGLGVGVAIKVPEIYSEFKKSPGQGFIELGLSTAEIAVPTKAFMGGYKMGAEKLFSSGQVVDNQWIMEVSKSPSKGDVVKQTGEIFATQTVRYKTPTILKEIYDFLPSTKWGYDQSFKLGGKIPGGDILGKFNAKTFDIKRLIYAPKVEISFAESGRTASLDLWGQGIERPEYATILKVTEPVTIKFAGKTSFISPENLKMTTGRAVALSKDIIIGYNMGEVGGKITEPFAINYPWKIKGASGETISFDNIFRQSGVTFKGGKGTFMGYKDEGIINVLQPKSGANIMTKTGKGSNMAFDYSWDVPKIDSISRGAGIKSGKMTPSTKTSLAMASPESSYFGDVRYSFAEISGSGKMPYNVGGLIGQFALPSAQAKVAGFGFNAQGFSMGIKLEGKQQPTIKQLGISTTKQKNEIISVVMPKFSPMVSHHQMQPQLQPQIQPQIQPQMQFQEQIIKLQPQLQPRLTPRITPGINTYVGVPPPPIIIIPPIPFSLEFGKTKGFSMFGKQKTKYTPSLGALTFNIKAQKMPKFAFSGLVTRPIISSKRRKRRK